MKWHSTKQFLPGNEYIYQPAEFIETQFYVIYHHGDNALMTNLATWDGKRFILGTLCYCDKCKCECYYMDEYSKECEVTHWMPLELPEFEMDIYFDE